LHEHTWPGNIRELVNCLDYACAVSGENCIEISDLPERMQQAEETSPREPVVELGADAIAMLKAALQRRHWNISAVARELNLHRSTLYRQMHRYGVLPPPR
jgi:transcriptional regulator of acetoin/glycerol metabolism